MDPNQRDEAGPLWLLFESVLESLGPWGRLALAVGLGLAFVGLMAVMTHRKA